MLKPHVTQGLPGDDAARRPLRVAGAARRARHRGSCGERPGLAFDDAERRLIGRIDGLSLLQVTPLREVEILMACKRLAARGIISL
jgi:hypothetical protein